MPWGILDTANWRWVTIYQKLERRTYTQQNLNPKSELKIFLLYSEDLTYNKYFIAYWNQEKTTMEFNGMG